jgi:hypothetical protein
MALTGCAMHAPMSEMVMFHEKESPEGSYNARYSHALGSFTMHRYDPEAFETYVDNNLSAQGDTTLWPQSTEFGITSNAIFMFEQTDRVAVSLLAGLPFGADATLKLPADIYLSGVGAFDYNNFLNNLRGFQSQLILQRRLLDGNPVGASLGISWKNANLIVPYDAELESVSRGCIACGIRVLGHYKVLQSQSLGIRGVFMISKPTGHGQSRPFLYLTGSYNYDFALDMTYPKIGVSFGFY